MKIDAHIIAWNEELILPYTLDHYSNICDNIFVYDNMSTDGSYEIYKRYPKVNVIEWDSGGEINEHYYVNIKSKAYRLTSRNCDWVIVCDCDEFLYHSDLFSKLEEYKSQGVTVPKISGHDMVCQSFPEYDGVPLVDKVKIGSKIYDPMCKSIIFNPSLNVRYGIGGHSFTVENNIGLKVSETPELKLLHYKFLGKDYVKKLYDARAERLSEFNKLNKFGEHYNFVERTQNYMEDLLKEGYKVI